jgi:tetratricopeptide (TPR) repeat protein
MLTPQKAKRAYEHAESALVGNELEDAEKELNSALGMYPKSAVAWCLMGTLHEEKLQLDKAFTDYSQALLADSQLQAAYLGLARIAFREKRWQEVVRFTDHVASVNPIAFPVAYLYP